MTRFTRNLCAFFVGCLIGGLFCSSYAFATRLTFDPQGNIIGSDVSDKYPHAYPGGVAQNSARSVPIRTPSGVTVPVPVNAAARIPSGAVARAAAARAVSALAGPVGAIATAVQVAEELNKAGVGRHRRCPDSQEHAFICEVLPDVPPGYPVNPASTGWISTHHPCAAGANCSAEAAVDANCKGHVGATALPQWSKITLNDAKTRLTVWCTTSSGSYSAGTVTRSDPYVPGEVVQPATVDGLQQSLQDILDADYEANRRLLDELWSDMANDPGFPSEHNPVKSDTPVEVTAPPVTTPERTKSTSTKTNPDGSVDTTTVKDTTTVTPKVDGTTVGNTSITFVTNTTTTSTTTNNVTNQTTIVETTEEATDSEDDLSFQDPSFSDVPTLYEQKYPDGIAGVWRDSKPDVAGTQFWQGIQQMFPSFGGGTCPAWSLSFNILPGANFGSMPFNVPCWIFQAVGLILMTTAAFTARKIIF